jgi:hypothetical protein
MVASTGRVVGQHRELTFGPRHDDLLHLTGGQQPLRRHQLELQEIGHQALR